MPFSGPPDLKDDGPELAVIAARHCRLPHPNVVRQFDGAVFPTIRDQKHRITLDTDKRLMRDDNVTAKWALFWSHGYTQTYHPKGWTVAHVWAAPKDPDAYSNLANLCLMPECLGSLSDKMGPLGPYLKYHALSVYGWSLASTEAPAKPKNFDDVTWTYFKEFDESVNFIHSRLKALDNQRVRLLRPLMGIADAE